MASSPSGGPTPSSKPSTEAPSPSSQTPHKVLEGHSDIVKRVAFFPYGRRLLSASHDGTIFIWDVESGEVEKKVTGHTASVNSIVIAPDGSIFASGSKDRTLRFWHGLTGEPEEPPIASGFKGREVWGVSFSPDGLRVAATCASYVHIWDTRTRDPIVGPLEVPSGGYYTTAFSPDGSRIAADAADGTVRVWDSVSGEVVFDALKGHSSTVRCAAFTPDGEQLVTCAEDNAIRRWDMESGDLIGVPHKGHTDTVYSIVPSPNGKILASSGADRTVRFWDLKTGDPKPTFLQHDSVVHAAAFSSDGRLLAVACHDTKVYIWDMKAVEAEFKDDNDSFLDLPATMPLGQSADVAEVDQHSVDPLDFMATGYGPPRPHQRGPAKDSKKKNPSNGFKKVLRRFHWQQNVRSLKLRRRDTNGDPLPPVVGVHEGRMDERNVAGDPGTNRGSIDENQGTPVVYHSESDSDEELPDPYEGLNIVVRYLCYCTCVRSR
ncbi:hypothetical protein HYDPIDRAFT_119553 [Hydnomerulius pinastri MD-312]|uniref:WD40 repeat-like protein n=1 Tax=Hydnomerulius pinastri MD-312 TaxID=994086 RepID=A0A0C9W7H2_9AGAM|nr:hypothetical protein HYDPIDRAFT_119553 [Hydnomerulius pinastri MD-312]